MLETQPLTRAQFLEAINRCIAAFKQVRAQLPKDAFYHAKQDNHAAACRAYLSELPVLFDPQSFQLYIACIAHGASIGAIDPIDVGRFCHIAQTAMSAWKLANPAAQKKEKKAHPLPTKGNHLEEEENRMAALHLPDRKTQNELYKSLRQRGIPVPSELSLRNNPLVALYFCDLARNHLDKLPSLDNHLGPELGREAPKEPVQTV